MSTADTGAPQGGAEDQAPSEDELRAAYEAEIKKIRVEQIVLEQVVTLINLGMRRTGLSPGTEDERDLGQVQLAIESVRALMPIVEHFAGPQAGQIRDALSQLQMAFVRLGGGSAGAGAAPGGVDPAATGGAGAAPGGPAAPGSAGPSTPGAPGSGSSAPPASGPTSPGSGEPGGPGPAQRTGRLWVPGQ